MSLLFILNTTLKAGVQADLGSSKLEVPLRHGVTVACQQATLETGTQTTGSATLLLAPRRIAEAE